MSTLVDVLQRHAATRPDQPLYTFLADGESESGTLTYAQLDRAARALAAALLERAAPSDRAMLLYPVGLEYLVGFFGCLYAGIVAVPAYPLKAEGRSGLRIQTMIDDADPRLVLTCERLRPGVENAIRDLGRSSVAVLGTDQAFANRSASDFSPRAAPDRLAFLQYTSASVAEAKGVRITHANLMANQEMIRRAMAHDEQSHFVSWLPPYHDMGLVGNLLQPLYLGASCVFMPPAAFVQRPLRWLAAISTYRARTSGAPNFAYDLCVKKIAPDHIATLDLSSWTIAYCGAEPVDARVAERFSAQFAPAGFRAEAFYPCYGLAEVTLMASGCDPHRAPDTLDADPDWLERGRLEACHAARGRRLVSCGVAPSGSQIAIVKPESRERAADGWVGEIWVRGAHVADGYWNRPELSREIFEARIEDDAGGGTFLRTGDLGALLDEQLYVVGRIKELVVHRGRNLCPTDIEAVVEASAGDLIDSCAAFAIPGEDTEGIGVVMEVSRRGWAAASAQAAAESIAWDLYRAFDVMPARLVFAKKGAIPRTSSGKKQRLLCARLLAIGELSVVADWVGDTAPPTDADASEAIGGWLARLIHTFSGVPLERIVDGTALANAWSLDSLRAVEIAHRIERRTGVTLPPSMFYEAATLDAIVREIERRRREAMPIADASEAVCDETPSPQIEMDVTPGQEAVWFSQQIDPASPAFLLRWALRCRPALDADRLCEAVRAVIARHDGLRWVFHLDAEGGVRARALPAGVVDYEQLTGDDDRTLVDWIDRESERSFDLERNLLVRVRHARGPDGDLVGFSLHHLVADLWSCALFTEEVLEHYVAGASLGRPQSFHRYARHVRSAHVNAGAYLPYWRRRLADAPSRDPVDVLIGGRSRGAVRRYAGASVSSTLDAATSEALRESARSRGISRQMLLLSIYGVWMWHLTQLEDFVTGCLTSGRGRAAFARVQGLLANAFAVRFRITPHTAFATVTAAARDQVLGALEREAFPFQAVVRDLKSAPELARMPLFQNMFVYQQLPAASTLARCVVGGDSAPVAHRGLTMQCHPLPQRSARFDFTLYGIDVDSRIAWEIVYNTDLFDRSPIADMLSRFELLVSRVPQLRPDALVGELTAALEPAF